MENEEFESVMIIESDSDSSDETIRNLRNIIKTKTALSKLNFEQKMESRNELMKLQKENAELRKDNEVMQFILESLGR